MVRKLTLLTLFLLSLAIASCAPSVPGPKHVIVMVGDGMGFEQLDAASLYAYGEKGKLTMQSLPFGGSITTWSAGPKDANNPDALTTTDSGAAATALATGVKVNNLVISKRIPGNGNNLETILEKYAKVGRKTGLVTTTTITHATPASFGAHAEKRADEKIIAEVYLQQTRPNVLYGGTSKHMSPDDAAKAGYTVVTNRAEMQKLLPGQLERVLGQFGPGLMPYEFSGRAPNAPGYDWPNAKDANKRFDYTQGKGPGYDTIPHLWEMTSSALSILELSNKGFFLMIEGGKIDGGGHTNHLANNIHETLEFDKSIKVVLEWARKHTDTLVIVTADHETGGLTVVQSNGKGNWPTVTWSTTGHTGTQVPLYAWGVGAHLFAGQLDNTDIPKLIARASTTQPVSAAQQAKTCVMSKQQSCCNR